MFAKNKEIFALIIILFISAGLFYWTNTAIGSFSLVGKTLNKDFLVTAFNGFSTAFFAFIFLGLSYLVKTINSRKIIHFNALVNLEGQLNEMLGIIRDNIYTMSNFRKPLITGNVSYGRIRIIDLDKSILEKLYDIELINKIFSFYSDLRKINDDLENLQNGYDEVKNAYIQKLIGVEQYVDNCKLMLQTMEQLIAFCEETEEQIIDLLALVRIQLRKDKPFTTYLQQKFIYSASEKVTIGDLEKEKTKLYNEIEQSSLLSEKRIENVLRKRKK